MRFTFDMHQRRTPTMLRALAKREGTTPDALLRDVLERHETYTEAAAEFGVSEATLRRWVRRMEELHAAS